MNDLFQEAWDDPEKVFALYVDSENGFMVLPDGLPVVEHHVLIIIREETRYQELPPVRQLQMMALANLVAEHMNKVLKPKRNVGYAIWGNQIKIAHIHLLPRNKPEDGIKFFNGERKKATAKQLESTLKLLKFPPKLENEARIIVDPLQV